VTPDKQNKKNYFRYRNNPCSDFFCLVACDEILVSAEKNLGEAQAGGRKEQGAWGKWIFARLLCPPKAGCGAKSGSSLIRREAKPAKIVSLLERIFCVRPLKMFQFLRALSAVRQRAAGRDCRPSGGNQSGFCRK
jgi:hypothetical protein